MTAKDYLALQCLTMQSQISLLNFRLSLKKGEWDQKNEWVKRNPDGTFATNPGNTKRVAEIPSEVDGEQPDKDSFLDEIKNANTPDQKDELLAKRIAYRLETPSNDTSTPEKKDRLANAKTFLEKEGYEVDQVFDDPKTGFTAFGLISKTGEAKLVFTGTNDDTDWEGNREKEVGRTQFETNKTSIKDFLKKHKNVSLLGHSLGGALSQITVSEFPELIKDVKTYNATLVTTETAKKFIDNLKKLPPDKEPPKITHFIKDDDIVSSYGQKFVAGDVREFTVPKGDFDRHPHLSIMTNMTEKTPAKWAVKKASPPIG